MRPPRNPLAGTRQGGQARRKKIRRGLFIPSFLERRKPGEMRPTYVEDTADAGLRELGVPVFDRHAAGAELGSYMARGRRTK